MHVFSEYLFDMQIFVFGNVFETVIPRNIRLSEAPSFGQSIFAYAPDCSGAMAYKDLADEIIKIDNGK